LMAKHITTQLSAFSILVTHWTYGGGGNSGKEAMSLNMPEFVIFQRILELQVTGAP